MGITFVQTNGSVATSAPLGGGSISVPITPGTVGNTLLVTVVQNLGTGASSLSDSASTVYQLDGSKNDGVSVTVQVWSALIATTGVSSISVNGLGSLAVVEVGVYEFAGLAPSAWVDTQGNGSGIGTSVSAGPTAGNLAFRDLAFAAFGSTATLGTFTGGGSAIALASVDQTGGSLGAEYNLTPLAGATDTETGTFSVSGTWAGVIVAYRCAATNVTRALNITQTATPVSRVATGSRHRISASYTALHSCNARRLRSTAVSTTLQLFSDRNKIIHINEAAVPTVIGRRNLVLLTVVESAAIHQTARVLKPHIIAQVTTPVHLSNVIKRSLALAETTAATVTAHHSAIRVFLIHESTITSVQTPAIHRTIKVAASTALREHTLVNFPMVAHALSNATVQANSQRPHSFHIGQPTSPHLVKNPDKSERVTEATVVHEHTTHHKNEHVLASTHVVHHNVATKALTAHETTAVHKHADTLQPFRVTETTAASHHESPHITRRIAETTAVDQDQLPNIVPRIHEPVSVVVHDMTHHAPFVLHETTTARHIVGLNAVFTLHEMTSARMGPKHVKKYIPVHVTTRAIVLSPSLTRLTFPIMGHIYQPTDAFGSQIPVMASLADYYYWFNTDDIPSLYWGPSDLSADRTNDMYDFWKTK